eukprot:s2580_g9.t3
MGSRRGLGKAKHVDTQYHWVQDRVAKRYFRLKKVDTGDMLADVLTKPAVPLKPPFGWHGVAISQGLTGSRSMLGTAVWLNAVRGTPVQSPRPGDGIAWTTADATKPPGRPGDLQVFVPRELCQDGTLKILTELATLTLKDGSVPPEIAELEFLRLFGPQRLQHQVFHSLHMECSADVHRVVAKVCVRQDCDELSKYSLPRCHVSLGLPYDFGDSNFLYAPSCERTGQFYCPPGLPLALQLTLKAGSRSATVWAAMLEGLMPAVVSARRTLAVSLSDSDDAGGSKVGRFAREWLEHDEMRLGCPGELAFFSISRGVHMLNEGRVGLPMALCPSCCKTAAGRLRVVFIRDPVSRMSSFYHGYWFPNKGHLLPGQDRLERHELFETWVELILNGSSPMFEASDLDHVRPALRQSLGDGNVVFCLEDVEKSLQRVESALCRGYGHCTPLPRFPAVKFYKKPKRESLQSLSSEVAQLVRLRFRFDYEALSTFYNLKRTLADGQNNSSIWSRLRFPLTTGEEMRQIQSMQSRLEQAERQNYQLHLMLQEICQDEGKWSRSSGRLSQTFSYLPSARPSWKLGEVAQHPLMRSQGYYTPPLHSERRREAQRRVSSKDKVPSRSPSPQVVAPLQSPRYLSETVASSRRRSQSRQARHSTCTTRCQALKRQSASQESKSRSSSVSSISSRVLRDSPRNGQDRPVDNSKFKEHRSRDQNHLPPRESGDFGGSIACGWSRSIRSHVEELGGEGHETREFGEDGLCEVFGTLVRTLQETET